MWYQKTFLDLTMEIWVSGCQNLNSSVDTIWSQKNIWSFTAVHFLDVDFFPVKGETPECLPALTLKYQYVLP